MVFMGEYSYDYDADDSEIMWLDFSETELNAIREITSNAFDDGDDGDLRTALHDLIEFARKGAGLC